MGGVLVAEWIPVYILLAPVAYKVITLRVFKFDKGLVYMEFGKPFYQPTAIVRKIVKGPRKQVSQ